MQFKNHVVKHFNITRPWLSRCWGCNGGGKFSVRCIQWHHGGLKCPVWGKQIASNTGNKIQFGVWQSVRNQQRWACQGRFFINDPCVTKQTGTGTGLWTQDYDNVAQTCNKHDILEACNITAARPRRTKSAGFKYRNK